MCKRGSGYKILILFTEINLSTEIYVAQYCRRAARWPLTGPAHSADCMKYYITEATTLLKQNNQL